MAKHTLKFCKIFKNTFLTEHLWATAFVNSWFHDEVSDIFLRHSSTEFLFLHNFHL